MADPTISYKKVPAIFQIFSFTFFLYSKERLLIDADRFLQRRCRSPTFGPSQFLKGKNLFPGMTQGQMMRYLGDPLSATRRRYPLYFIPEAPTYISPQTLSRCLPELYRQWTRNHSSGTPLRMLQRLDFDLRPNPCHRKALEVIARYFHEHRVRDIPPLTFLDALERRWDNPLPPSCCGPFHAIELLDALSTLLDYQAFGCGREIAPQFTTFFTKHCEELCRDRQLWPRALRALDRMSDRRNASGMINLLSVAAQELQKHLGPNDIIRLCCQRRISNRTRAALAKMLPPRRVGSVQDVRDPRPPGLELVGRSHSYPEAQWRRSGWIPSDEVSPDLLEAFKDENPDGVMVDSEELEDFVHSMAPLSTIRMHTYTGGISLRERELPPRYGQQRIRAS